MRRGEAFELGCGEGDCAGIGAIGPGRSAPLTAPDTLRAGDSLLPGQWLLSKNRQWALTLQAADGNLVLYNQGDGNGYWNAETPGTAPGKLAMQSDGNLVIYDRRGAPIWDVHMAGQGPSVYLLMQSDGNLVLYNGTTALWQSNTVGGVIHEDSSFLEDVVSTFEDVVSKIAPFAELAISFVPGVGAVVNGAIAAGISLAEGNSITDALLSGTANALPGGPLIKAAFDVGVGIVKGEKVSTIALNTARDNLPGGAAAVAAFDVAVSLAVGQQVQHGNIAAVQVLDPSAPKVIVPPAPVGPPAAVAPFLYSRKSSLVGVTLASGPSQALIADIILTQKGKAELAAKKARKVALGVAGAGALGAAAWLLL